MISNDASHGREIRLHTMMGHKHIALAAKCLASIVKYNDLPVHVVIHEDGSVTEEDKAELWASVPNASFIHKSDADGPMNEFLAKYPACKKLRDNLVFGLKIFDIQVLGSGENLAYTDCDIIFTRPVSGLFEMPKDPNIGGIFMKDPIQAYCLRSTQLFANPKVKLADRLNGGLLYFRRKAFDWDLVEWFLSHEQFSVHPYWKEQTAWSVLASASRSWMWNERQVRVVTSENDFDTDLSVAHFVSNYRGLIDKIPSTTSEILSPVRIMSGPGGVCTPLSLAVDEFRRKFMRYRRYSMA